MVHAEDLQNLDKALEDAIQANGEFHGEFRIIRVDGAQRWLETTAQIIYDDGGNPTRIIGVSTDITRRKVVEERERQLTAEAIAANAKFRAVFEQTAVFAGIMSLDGILIDTNRLSLEACGYRAEEILGRPFWETGWWRGSAEVQAKIRAGTTQAAQGVPYREVLPYHCADGSERLVDFGLHPITDDRGQILFLHPTGVDITDLKRAEEDYRTLAETLNAEVRTRTYELEQRTVEVVRQSELLRQFSQRLLQAQDEERRRIARELHDSAGQLLTALGMSLSNIVQQGRGTDDRLASAAEQSQQLVQQLSQEIRTMSYLLHPPLLDEIGLADALHWYVEGLKERSTLEIELIVSQGFGRLSRELELVLFRLVQECLTNIHRHSGSKTASIFLARQRSKVVLEVQDRGRGIPPEKLLQIHSQGSGVGIRGMRERVRQFDGTMNIESNDRGTYISFSFPLVTAEAPIGGLAEDRTKSPDYAS
jgi:PAS domain S-box-containing protein